MYRSVIEHVLSMLEPLEFLLSGKTRFITKTPLSDSILREHFPAIQFSLLLHLLPFYFPGEASPTVCSLGLRVNFLLSGQTTLPCHSLSCHARVQGDKLPTCPFLEEGRESLKGTLLTEGKRLPQQQTVHTAFPWRP